MNAVDKEISERDKENNVNSGDVHGKEVVMEVKMWVRKRRQEIIHLNLLADLI